MWNKTLSLIYIAFIQIFNYKSTKTFIPPSKYKLIPHLTDVKETIYILCNIKNTKLVYFKHSTAHPYFHHVFKWQTGDLILQLIL